MENLEASPLHPDHDIDCDLEDRDLAQRTST
jgi:hypothetical protein